MASHLKTTIQTVAPYTVMYAILAPDFKRTFTDFSLHPADATVTGLLSPCFTALALVITENEVRNSDVTTVSNTSERSFKYGLLSSWTSMTSVKPVWKKDHDSFLKIFVVLNKYQINFYMPEVPASQRATSSDVSTWNI